MDVAVCENWQNYAEAFAIMGNLLLTTPNRLEVNVVKKDFWDAFPPSEDSQVNDALSSLKTYLANASDDSDDMDLTTRVSVEQTKLFMGLPEPAAAPWETFYIDDTYSGSASGFGKATFEMQELLKENQFQLSGQNNQYADHIGIELLLLSELCKNVASCGADAQKAAIADVQVFCANHPFSWIGKLQSQVAQTYPDGWVIHLLSLSERLMAGLMAE